MQSVSSTKIKISKSQTKDLVIQDPVPVYLGATFYFNAYPITDKTGTVADHAYVDLTNNRILTSNEMKNEMAINTSSPQADAENGDRKTLEP